MPYALLKEENGQTLCCAGGEMAEAPIVAPIGWAWQEVESWPLGGVQMVPFPTFANQMTQLFDALPVEARAQFGALRSAVKDFIEAGDIEAAQYVIEIQEVPQELEPIKAQLLALFEE